MREVKIHRNGLGKYVITSFTILDKSRVAMAYSIEEGPSLEEETLIWLEEYRQRKDNKGMMVVEQQISPKGFLLRRSDHGDCEEFSNIKEGDSFKIIGEYKKAK